MTTLPSLDALKAQAKALRNSLAAKGHAINHAQSLELLAKQLGHRDWNTLHAAVGQTPQPLHLGQHVSGFYLGKAFAGKIICISDIGHGVRFRLTLRFDAPVNVSKFDSMVIELVQVNATVDRHGQTAEKTSDGTPHLIITRC